MWQTLSIGIHGWKPVVVETDKKIVGDVSKRTIIAIIFAVFCTSAAIYLLTFFGVLPEERFYFELMVSAAITVGVTSIVAPIVFWKIFKLVYKLDVTRSELRLQAERDFLTKLANRRGLEAKAGTLIAQAKQSREPVSMVVLDIDNFKTVNDTYGHQAGDQVICTAAEAIFKVTEDLKEFEAYAGRIGGEEYAIILRGLTRRELTELVEKLRVACEVKAARFGSIEIPFTVSVGSTVCGHDDVEYDNLIRIADRALYRAKENGRNRCTFVEYGKAKAAA